MERLLRIYHATCRNLTIVNDNLSRNQATIEVCNNSRPFSFSSSLPLSFPSLESQFSSKKSWTGFRKGQRYHGDGQ